MLIKKDPDLLQAYLEDYSNIKGGFCESVLFPETEQDAIEAISDYGRRKIPLTITAAGTGVTGGRVPFGGSVLSVEKLNHISSVENYPQGGVVITVGAGVRLKDIIEKIKHSGFFYPPDPTEKASFISGNISTSASGARSYKYGSTRKYIMGLKLLLSDGSLLWIERGEAFAKGRSLKLVTEAGKEIRLSLPKYEMPCVKNAAGYFVKDNMDPIDLFIGQEGTLGVILSACLRLVPKPREVVDCYVFFNDVCTALNFVYTVKSFKLKINPVISPCAIEYFDNNALSLLRSRHEHIPKTARAAVYFEQEIDTTPDEAIEAWAKLIDESGGELNNTWFAQSDKERQQLIDIRHDLPDMVNEFLKHHNLLKVGTDIAVSDRCLPEMIAYYESILKGHGFHYIVFGHIGESHLHVNILSKNADEQKKAFLAYDMLVRKAISLGGTPTAEHGIGKMKHKYLEMLYGKTAVLEMAALKKQLDPACILGLDNIFSRNILHSL